MVRAVMGVPKPRTRHAAGPEAPRNAGPSFRHVSQGAKVHERKHRSTSRPSGLRDGAGVLRWTSAGKRKRKGGPRPAKAGSGGSATREPGGRRNAERVVRNQ